ncbi:MAG: transcription termination/antitermination protein NusA [Zetaproteobacteria bacterium]|nr:transcription termination/antitermination protein NusA [Pseudobdellovibrionaceae bacterium]
MPFLDAGGKSIKLADVVTSVSRDKNLDKSIIIEALEHAVLHAARRKMGATADIEANYNEETDEIDLFQYRTVVEDEEALEDNVAEITFEEAKKLDPDVEVGDALGINLETKQFGRIAAQAAKQIIVQKVREAERALVYDEFKDRIGEVLSGYVVRVERKDIIVDLGRTEAVIPVKEQMVGERFRVKDRVQGYVVDVRKATRGAQVILSRAHTGFITKLFEEHVTEIYDGIVTVESAARDAGLRSKVAVHSKDPLVDPVGACVGMKGARVQAIVQELNGEKVDIVPWDSDPAKLVCNALAPAVVSKVIVDDEHHSMEVVVAEDQLSLAIGKKGQNVRLAAQLSGWKLDIKSELKVEEQLATVKKVLADIAGLGDMHAGILVHEGIKTPEELSEVNPRILCRLLNLELDNAEKIIEAAKVKASEIELGQIQDTEDYQASDAAAIPQEEAPVKDSSKADREARIAMFKCLGGVGEAAAYALADAGYITIGDIVADSADEVAQKSGLSLGVARTVQIAADRYLQEIQSSSEASDND